MDKHTRVLGIDEAGRGPVLGPMVVGGVLVRAKDIAALAACNVKDSKLLTAEQRQRLRAPICEIAHAWQTVSISPRDIDEDGLTRTELNAITQLICELKPDVAVIDTPSPSPQAYRQILRRRLGKARVRLIIAARADLHHPVVSAASILAKLTRDEQIEALSRTYGEIGSGYATDKVTLAWLQQYIRVNRGAPKMARKRWITVQRLLQIRMSL